MPNDNNPDNSSSFWQQYGVPIVSGAGSLLNSGLNWLSNWFIGRQNQQFAEQQATTAFDRQQQLIREQRAYDSPLAQMQRLIDAGLNPNLIYSDLGDGMPSASAPQGAVPEIRSPNLDAGVNAALQQRLLNAQIREMESKTDLTYAEAQRIIHLTPAEFSLVTAQSERIQQIISSEEFQTSVNQVKAELFKSDGEVTVSYPHLDDGRWNGRFDAIGENFRSLVINNDVQSLYSSYQDYILLVQKFYNDVFGGQLKNQNQQFENQKLEYFLQFAESIYKSQGDQAAFISAMSQFNLDAFGSLNASPQIVRWLISAVQLLLNGVSTFK